MFFAVRPSYAKKFLHALLKSPAYHSFLAEEEMKSISEEDQRTFCNGTFSTENSVSSLIAEYCNDFPENLFPKLLPQSTVIFTDESDYSGVHIAIDPGGKTDEKKSRGAAYN